MTGKCSFLFLFPFFVSQSHEEQFAIAAFLQVSILERVVGEASDAKPMCDVRDAHAQR